MGSIPVDHPYRRELARLERQAGDDIAAALNRLRRDLFQDIGRGNVAEMLMRLRDKDINERLRQALYNALLPTVELGAEMGRGYIEAEILGVKRVTISDPAFNWELINEAARAWLRKHTFLLTYANEFSITEATAARLRGEIDNFISAPDMTINQLSERVSGLFDVVRGEMIAVTEVTRAFAQSNVEAWRAAEVVQRKRWNTAVDELVCPICAPLNGKEVGIDESFGGFYDGPPAHPRCRCWVTPVVDTSGETLQEQSEFEFIASGGTDPFIDIRPPAGRAPRGQGQEYADRRWIVQRIGTQMRNRDRLQSQLDRYRGQANQRYRITEIRQRIQELDRAIEASLATASEPMADWDLKRALVGGILDVASALRTFGT